MKPNVISLLIALIGLFGSTLAYSEQIALKPEVKKSFVKAEIEKKRTSDIAWTKQVVRFVDQSRKLSNSNVVSTANHSAPKIRKGNNTLVSNRSQSKCESSVPL